MSTTLTNGLKLPDKGSVDWYADMQNNYTILDGAVGTIADHTTAIAGKAASSHTHTKSDVTDLLNSNFIPSANNSYDLGSSSYQWNKIYSADVVHTSGDETITGIKTLTDYWRLQAKNLKAGEGETYGRTGYSVIYTDKNAATMGDVTLFKNANAARTFIRIRGGDYYTNGAPAAAGTLVQSVLMVVTNVSGKKIIECDSDIVYPTTNNATDLGSSTNKWKSVYSDSYYYGTTAWGLNQQNEWTNFNTFNGYRLRIKHTAQEIGVIPASNQWNGFQFTDKNNNQTVSFEHAFMGSGETRFKISMVDNVAFHDSGSTVWIEFLRLSTYSGGSGLSVGANLSPLGNNLNLGSSTNKWKSFNGVNPGALSICNPSATPDPISFPNGVNESGTWKYDGSAWNALDVSNIGDGWIIITYNACAAGDYILARFGGTGGNRYPSMIFKAEILAGSTSAYLYAFFPVAKAFGNIYLEMKINSNANLVLHHFMPAYGTV